MSDDGRNALEGEVPDCVEQGRSFSSAPCRAPRYDEASLTTLRLLESALAERLRGVLTASADVAALVGRVGSDLTRHRFEGERPRYSHVGIALREGRSWRIHHLLNTHEGPRGDLYRHRLVDFFRDDPFEHRVIVVVPSPVLQRGIADVLTSPVRESLHTTAYSRIAYPWSTRYQNSNQWILEVVAAAQSGAIDRAVVQRYLAARGFRPSILLAHGLLGQWVGTLLMRGTRFDDHPMRERLRGRFSFVLESSVRRYVATTDSIVAKHVLHAKTGADGVVLIEGR